MISRVVGFYCFRAISGDLGLLSIGLCNLNFFPGLPMRFSTGMTRQFASLH